MNRAARRWRDLAALLATGVGVGWVALLWFRPLTAPTLLGALLGTVYLFVAIGLFGQSRFSLYLAIALSTAVLVSLWPVAVPAGLELPWRLREGVDGIVILCASAALWRGRGTAAG